MDNVAVYQAKETLDIAHEISKLLDCGLDKESLAILIAPAIPPGRISHTHDPQGKLRNIVSIPASRHCRRTVK